MTLQPPSPVHEHRSADEQPRLRVSAFVAVRSRVLLVRQQRAAERDAPAYWLLPGGGVHFRETLAAALVREVDEELGVRVAPGQPVGLLESISPDPQYTKHVVHVVLTATWPSETLADVTPCDDHILAARFFAADELSSLQIRPPFAGTLERWLEHPPRSMEYLGCLW